jgi:AcrR family transcriptional regulator
MRSTLHGCLTGYRIDAMEANVRPLRADAARNRARVLDAARSAFAEAGLDVGVEEIARRAGVGKGTLYRRFPTKEALVRAIFEDILEEIDRIVALAEAEADPWRAFTQYLAATARMQASNQGFYDVVAQRLGGNALSDQQRRRVTDSTARVLKRAQDAQVVRRDLVPEDVTIMLRMVGAATRPAPDGSSMDNHWPRYLGLLLDAIRPPAATPLPADPWRLKAS